MYYGRYLIFPCIYFIDSIILTFPYLSIYFICIFSQICRSYGHQLYRQLEYTSNARLCMRELQPSLDERMEPWEMWERYEAQCMAVQGVRTLVQ